SECHFLDSARARIQEKLLACLQRVAACSDVVKQKYRSEERRVGEECRSLCDWSPDVCSSDLSECHFLDSARARIQEKLLACLQRVAACSDVVKQKYRSEEHTSELQSHSA